MRSIIDSSSRFFAVVLVGAVVIVLAVGCGRNEQQSAQSKPPTASTTSSSSAKPEPSQTRAVQNDKKTSGAGSEPAPQPPKDESPKLEMTQEGVTLQWTENGQLRMDAKARELVADEVTKTGMLLDFSAKLYENGKLTATLTAPKAVADRGKRTVTATGGVTLKSLERSTVVKSNWVKWFARDQKVIGNGGVKINSTAWNVQGAAFEADTALKTLSVKNSTKGLVPE